MRSCELEKLGGEVSSIRCLIQKRVLGKSSKGHPDAAIMALGLAFIDDACGGTWPISDILAGHIVYRGDCLSAGKTCT